MTHNIKEADAMLIITNMGVMLLQEGNIHSIPTIANNLLFFPYLLHEFQ